MFSLQWRESPGLAYQKEKVRNMAFPIIRLPYDCTMTTPHYSVRPIQENVLELRESTAGALQELPVEILRSILLRLDLISLSRVRLMNTALKKVVEELPERIALIVMASKPLRKMYYTRTLHMHSLGRLYQLLTQFYCDICTRFAPYINVLTGERCCLLCLHGIPGRLVNFDVAKRAYGLGYAQTRHLPVIWSMPRPGYGLTQLEELVQPEAIYQAAKEYHGTEERVQAVVAAQHRIRTIAGADATYPKTMSEWQYYETIRTDPDRHAGHVFNEGRSMAKMSIVASGTHDVQGAYRCRKCHTEAFIRDADWGADPQSLAGNASFKPSSIFTFEGILIHLEICQHARRDWTIRKRYCPYKIIMYAFEARSSSSAVEPRRFIALLEHLMRCGVAYELTLYIHRDDLVPYLSVCKDVILGWGYTHVSEVLERYNFERIPRLVTGRLRREDDAASVVSEMDDDERDEVNGDGDDDLSVVGAGAGTTSSDTE